jgi:hypothetical protein
MISAPAIRIFTFAIVLALGPAAVLAESRRAPVPYELASDAVAIYRGTVTAVGAEWTEIQVTSAVKGLELDTIEIFVGYPAFGPAFNPAPPFMVGQDVVVGLGELVGVRGRLWPANDADSALSSWPMPPMADIPGMTTEEAHKVLRALVAFVQAESVEARVNILFDMLSSNDSFMRWNALSVLARSGGHRISPSDAHWWKAPRCDDVDDFRRMFMLEYKRVLAVEERDGWWDAAFRELSRIPSPATPSILMRAIERRLDEGHGVSSSALNTLSVALRRWGMTESLSWVTHERRTSGDSEERVRFREWAEGIRAEHAGRRKSELRLELSDDCVLVRAAARAEWLVLVGEEPEGFVW